MSGMISRSMSRPFTPQEHDGLKALQDLPHVGLGFALDFWNIGIHDISDFKAKNPDDFYDRLCKHLCQDLDQSMLHLFRLAVYCASTPNPNPCLFDLFYWEDGSDPLQ